MGNKSRKKRNKKKKKQIHVAAKWEAKKAEQGKTINQFSEAMNMLNEQPYIFTVKDNSFECSKECLEMHTYDSNTSRTFDYEDNTDHIVVHLDSQEIIYLNNRFGAILENRLLYFYR